MRLKELYGGEVPGSSFCFIYSRLGVEEMSHLKMPMGADKKKKRKNPQENPALSRQRTREGAAYQNRKLLDNTSTLGKHHRKIVAPHQQRLWGKLRPPPTLHPPTGMRCFVHFSQ